jgi:hypothetical protein
MPYEQQHPTLDLFWQFVMVGGLPIAGIIVALSGARSSVPPALIIVGGCAGGGLWQLIWGSQPPVVEVTELRPEGVVLRGEPGVVHRVKRVRYASPLANPFGPRRLAAMFGDEGQNTYGNVVFLELDSPRGAVTTSFVSSAAATRFGAQVAATVDSGPLSSTSRPV